VFKLAAWCGLLALAIASWTPKAYMVRTGLGGLLEHAAAFAITATVFAIGYPWMPKWRIAMGLAMYAAILEIGQTWVPGRGPAILDWLVGTAGASLALGMHWTIGRRGRKRSA
jgi:VanZ family protein